MIRPTERPDRPAAPPPAPRFAMAWAALVYAIATLTLAWPALAGRFLVNPNSDQFIAGYAFRDFAANWIRSGHGVPLWNPYMFGGLPYVAGMHGDIFYPTALLRVLVGTDVGMTWGFVIHLFLAGLFTFLFLRALGVGFFAALVGGLAYMMGGNVAGLVSPGHDGKLFVATLLPLVLLLVHRGVRDGRAWAWGALALAITLAVLSPHPQLLQYMLITAGAYALFTSLARPDDGTAAPRSRVIGRLGLATAAVGVGLLGGAIQFLPLLEYTPWSPRAGGAGWEHAISYSMPPEELVNFYLPQFSGILELYWGRNAIHLHSEYIGAAVLVLLGLAWGDTGTRHRRRQIWFWSGALVVATLWALGGYTPFYGLVYAVVPGTKFFRAPSTMLYVVAFCIAVLAAFGTDRALSRRDVKPAYLIGWVVAGVVFVALAMTGAFSSIATTLAPPAPQFLDRVDAGAGQVTLGALRSLLVVVATAGLLFAFQRGRLTTSAAAWAIAAVVVLDLWSIERLYWRFSAPASVLYKSDAVVDFLKRIPQPGRVVPIAVQQLASRTRDPFLGGGEGRGTGFMVHGVRSVVGYHGNELGRYDELTAWPPDAWPREITWPQRIAHPNVRRLTNARFIYTNGPEPPLPGMRLVAGPATNASGNIVYLYEFPDDNPAAWVAPVAIKAPDENVLATVLDPRFDVRRAALFDPAAAVPVQSNASLRPPSDVGVRATRWEPGRISLTLDRPAPAGSALLVSENYYPGWTAIVDGKTAPVGRAQYVLIGVALPTGARSVELTFRSPSYERGKAITLTAVALAILALIAGRIVDRRRRG